MQDKNVKKLVVFPNDPIIEYYKKGEITVRYFNPDDFFDEVHIISFVEKEIEPEHVKLIAGDALLKIYKYKRICLQGVLWNIFDYFMIILLVKKINHAVVRGFNSNMTGCIAVSIANILKIPSVISLHINPEKDIRFFLLTERKYLMYIVWIFIGVFIEPYVLQNANRIICVYKFIVDYAVNNRGLVKVCLLFIITTEKGTGYFFDKKIGVATSFIDRYRVCYVYQSDSVKNCVCDAGLNISWSCVANKKMRELSSVFSQFF